MLSLTAKIDINYYEIYNYVFTSVHMYLPAEI